MEIFNLATGLESFVRQFSLPLAGFNEITYPSTLEVIIDFPVKTGIT